MKQRLRPKRSVNLPQGSSGCHDQQKDRNGDLDALHRRIQVRAMSLIITFLFEPAKLQMNCAKARASTARTAISGARAGEFCAMSSSVMQIGASDSAVFEIRRLVVGAQL